MKNKILIVEDDKNLAKLCVRIFKKMNIILDCVGSAEEALDIFEDPGHRVVLTDIDLPGMNGLELMKKIKEDHPSVKFAVMTGGSLTNEIQAIQKGADAFLSKPFNVRKLRETIDKLLCDTCSHLK